VNPDINVESIAIITLLLWLGLSLVFHGKVFDMDTAGTRYSFHAAFAIYRQIYAAISVFGIILAIFVDHVARSKVMFVLASIYALLFVLWTAYQYEHYQHQRYSESRGKSTYRGWKYALTLTLGGMSPILFAIGLLEFAYGQ
jgi:hypothetical protein